MTWPLVILPLLFLPLILTLPSPSPPTSPWPLYARQIPALSSDSDIFSCPAASWPPVNVGSLLTPQEPDKELQVILSEIDPKRIDAIITKLVSFGTRHTLSSQTDPNRGIGAATDWVEQQMRTFAATSNGQMEVTTPSYVQGVAERIPFPVRIRDVVATLKGSVEPERYYVVSGHIDSRCSDPIDYICDAPGADDEYVPPSSSCSARSRIIVENVS
ncbi:MAG: hypothetical protein Q9184_002103 [Pyrenodesmia sp. 2 TL-2023]